MFGGTGVTSSWTNPQQNQQQQPGSTAFGQPSNTFGGGGNTFGQNPQPQANPMFGNLATNPNPSAGGFGSFGGNTSQANATNPLFGGSKPATGFGAFGGGTGTSTFGGGGAFGGGTTNTGTSTTVFGQPTNSTGFATTTGSNLFSKPLTTGFGGAQTNTQGGAFDTVNPVSTGTANPPFTAFTEKDNTNTLQYQSISCMPQYRGSSFEELRLQDYAQGRKTAGAFGQSASFGTTAPTAPNTNIFGAPQQNANQPANPLFGGTTTNAFGTFGQPASTQNTTTGGTGTFGPFGQQQQQQGGTGFGTFGHTPQQPQGQTGTGLFSGGGFGTNKPATGFGTFSGGGNAFGGGGTFGTQPQQTQQPAGGLFGQQPQAQTNNAFGGFNANANANKPSLFGTQPSTQSNTGFGAFGQPQNQQGQQQQPGGGPFGGSSLFNTNQQTQPTTQAQPGGGLFGNTQPAQTGGGLFGTGGGLFGNQQQPNTQQPQNSFSNMFNKPPANTSTSGGGLFGNFGAQGTLGTSTNAGQQGGLFGNTSTNQQPSGTNAFSSLFGNKPNAPAMGQTQSTMGQSGAGALGGSLWGGASSLNLSANTPGAQGSMTASISQPIGVNLPIFSMLPPGPRAITLEQPKRKPGYFVDVPTRSPVPRLQLGYTPANSKLRGFGLSTTSTVGAGGNPFTGVSLTSGNPNALSLSRAVDNKAALGPDAFLGRSGSPSLGSGGRQSVKKLILDKKVEASDLFSKSGNSQKPGTPGRVTFSPALSVAAREKEAAAAAAAAATSSSGAGSVATKGPNESPTPASRGQRGGNRFTAQSTQNAVEKDGKGAGKEREKEKEEGEYWVKPDLDTLKHAGYDELVSFKGLVVGRVGYGEIHFLDPVDLTGLRKLGALLGQIVRFDEKECSVYPDVDEVDKPPPGTGLNVRARLILVRCWAQDKATREPIKDEKNPLAIRHLKRLKGMKDTEFESWNMEKGEWTFTVDHF